MEKIHTAQIAKTLVLFFLLFMIPFISSAMRTSYLYFILNLLILLLAIESGILTVVPSSKEEKKHVAQSHVLSSPFQNNPKIASTATTCTAKNNHALSSSSKDDEGNGFSILEKKPEKKPVALMATAAQKKIKKSYSRPSLFFIGGFGDEEDARDEETVAVTAKVEKVKREVEKEEEVFHDDLFTRAETFIGNFYNQLKIQREESWKKIHGLYHKPL